MTIVTFATTDRGCIDTTNGCIVDDAGMVLPPDVLTGEVQDYARAAKRADKTRESNGHNTDSLRTCHGLGTDQPRTDT